MSVFFNNFFNFYLISNVYSFIPSVSSKGLHMKQLVLLLSFFLSVTTSQAQTHVWAQRFGNIKSDKITAVKTDGLGYVYIAGYFSNSLTLGTNALVLNNIANATSKEAFIAKLDSTGYCLWARAGGEWFDDRVLGMDVDSAGYAVITGTYWEGSGISFPPLNITGAGLGSGDQCFIVKYDPNGTPLWGRFVCGNTSGDDQGFDVAIDKVGNIYTLGFMTNTNLICGNSTVSATNPNTGTHKHCYWLTKMDANGNFQWARTFGNLPWDPNANKYIERDIALCVDNLDGIYVTGGFDGTRQFGTETFTSLGGFDVFVLKYDANGVFKWATQAGSTKDDWSNGICSDKNGHIYITGEHRDSLYMDTVLVRNYDKRDVFLFKIDATTGKPIWGKRAGHNLGSERGNDVWADEKCNVYLVGDVNEGGKFGDNIVLPFSGLGVQTFVVRITPEGKWTWALTGGGPGDDDRANAVAKGKGYQLYVGGFFRNSATYGSTNLVSAGSSDAFLARIDDPFLDKGTPFTLDPPQKQVLCFGDTAHLEIPKHAYLHVTPTTGIQFNGDSTELVFSPSQTTTYTISGFSKGACAEYDTVSFTIAVGLDRFTLDPHNDTTVCKGEAITLAVRPHDNFAVHPTTGATISPDESTVTFSPDVTTTYTLTGDLLGVCPTYDTMSFTLNISPNPVASFHVNPRVAFLDEAGITLKNTSTNADFYRWYDESGELLSTDTSPWLAILGLGRHCYKLVAENYIGCIDSTYACGEVIQREKVFFPTAFSPNNDGRNDVFRIVLMDMNLQMIKGFSLTVVNRYGEVVFKSFDPNAGWDGTWRGNPCDIGTYFYSCSFVTPQGKIYDMKGDIALVK